MTRKTSVDRNGMKKGAWSEEEDDKLRSYILRYGHWNWRLLPKFAGLARCGKSCRLRWMNYLKPGLKRGSFTKEEEHLISKLHDQFGKKWSAMAARIPGRTDNEIKNFWHTHLKKRAKKMPSSSQITAVCKNNNAAINSEAREIISAKFQTTHGDNNNILESSGTSNPSVANASCPHSGREVDQETMLSEEQITIAENIDNRNRLDGFEGSFWSEPFMVDDYYSQDHSFSPFMDEDAAIYTFSHDHEIY